jgi:hypothetical protein
MERVELLTVSDTSWLPAKNTQLLILRPNFPCSEGWRRQGQLERIENVTIVRPDGHQIEATAHISTSHVNIADPYAPIEERWRITVWFTDRPKDDVPIGSKILVSQEVRDAILTHSAT